MTRRVVEIRGGWQVQVLVFPALGECCEDLPPRWDRVATFQTREAANDYLEQTKGAAV